VVTLATRRRLRQPDVSRSAIIHVALGLAVAAVAAVGAREVQHAPLAKAAAVVIVAAGTVLFLVTRRTGLALAAFMVYLGALDGFLKLSTGSTVVTFVRDGLLYAIVAGLVIRGTASDRQLQFPPLGMWVVAFVAIVIVEVANPNNGSLYHSLSGVRQDLEFVPLFFLAYSYMRTTRELKVFLIILALLAAANGIVTFIQFHLSPQQLAAWGPGYAERVLATGKFTAGRTFFNASGQNFVRPFGLGSEAGAGGLVAALSLGAILALISLPRSGRIVKVLAALSAIAAVVGVFTAQGRAVIVSAAVVVLAYALMSATSRRTVGTILAISVVVGAATVVLPKVLHSSNAPSLRYSGLTAGNLVQALVSNRGTALQALPAYLHTYPFGAGLGATGPAAGVSGAPINAQQLNAENEINFALLETGIPGLIVLVGLPVVVLGLAVTRLRSEPDPQARAMLAAIFAGLAGCLLTYTVTAATPTTPVGPYLWTAAGIGSYWFVTRPAERARMGDAAPA
jgi:hypothetical protein